VLRRLTVYLSLLLGVALLLSACAPPNPTATPVPTRTPTVAPSATPIPSATPARAVRAADVDPKTRAQVRFLVAVPDAPPVDIYIESTIAAARLEFGQVTESLPLNPDSYTLRIVLAGKPVTDDALLSERLDLVPNESVILAFTGTSRTFKTNRYAEDLSPVQSGKARVLFVNVAAAVRSAKVRLNDTDLTTIDSGGLPGAPQIIASGAQSVSLNSGNTAVLSQSILFQDRHAHTAILISDSSGKDSLLIVSSDTRREARIRVLHADSDLKPVDVYLGTKIIASKLEFRKGTDFTSTEPTSTEINIRTAGAAGDTAPIFHQPIVLSGDQTATVVIYPAPNPTYGQGGDQYITGMLVISEDTSPLKAGTSKLMVLNVARPAHTVLVTEQNRPIDGFNPLKYGGYSGAVAIKVRPQPLNFLMAPDNTAATPDLNTLSAVEVNSALNLQEGVSYLYVLTGRLVGNMAPFIATNTIGVEGGTTSDSLVSVPVRIINAMNGVPSIDLYSGSTLIAKGVAANTSSAVQKFTFTGQPFRITRRAETTALATVDAFRPRDPQSNQLLLIAVGTGTKPQLIQNVERLTTLTGVAQLTVIHAAPDGPAIYVEGPPQVSQSTIGGLDTPTPAPAKSVTLINRLDFGALSSPLPLRPDKYTFTVRDVRDGSLLATSDALTLEKGKRYNLLLISESSQLRLILLSGN